jgi:hypothetical protein
VLPLRIVTDAEQAAQAGLDLGFPVAVKATGLDALPKTEAAGVALDLHDGDDVVRAFERMRAAQPKAMETAVVQRMAPPGIDLRIRAVHHDVVGALVATGPGGAAGELLPDGASRIVPLTDLGAAALLLATPSSAPLDADGRAATENVLLRVAWLIDAFPEIAEVVVNPVIVSGTDAWVADARVRVAPLEPSDVPDVRRM